jgi:hypothetical protein
MGKQLIPVIEQIQDEDVLSWGKVLEKIEGSFDEKFLLRWDDKLDGESNEEHEYRNKLMEGETEQQFNLRRELRNNKII